MADSTATPPWSNRYKLKLLDLILDGGGPVTMADVAPIVAFQLNIVGQSGSTATAVFQSGAATITYTAHNPLTAFRQVPPCSEVSNPTAEISNSFYTTVPAPASKSLIQSFGVTAG